MSRVCAIVPTFNRAALVRECLDSLLRQTRPVDEIIVVIDGSTDNTEQVLATYGERISIIRQSNSGKSAALNAGLRQCRADYVWICDDDDIAAPAGLAPLVAALDSDYALDWVHGELLVFVESNRGREYLRPVQSVRPEEDSALIQVLEGTFPLQFAQLVRRSAYQRVGPFREDLLRSQDYEMTVRLTRHCRSKHVSDIIFHYREHQGARGPAAETHKNDERVRRWLHYEQIIFRDLRPTLGIEDIIPKFARNAQHQARQRAALLQRACIYAQKALWNETLDDLHAACSISQDPPRPEEIHLASRLLRNPFIWAPIVNNPDWTGRLKECVHSGAFGEGVVADLVRPLIYWTRIRLSAGRWGDVIAYVRFLLTVLGAPRFIRALARSAAT
jgi:glycosyltransferase involved in cell wall biosynthesis